MTDNSDFMSRYLPPENSEQHREHPAPADDVTEEVSLADVRLPEPGAPQSPHMPPVNYEFGPPPAEQDRHEGWRPASGGGEGAHAAAQPAPPPPPAAGPSFGPPPGGHPDTAPRSPGPRAPGAGQVPDPIPARPQFDQRTPPPPRWSPPRVDPEQRWAPRPDLRTPSSAPTRHVQVEEVVKRRREPAKMGWRKAVHACTGGLVNLGAGPHERQLIDWKSRVSSNIPGTYQIAAISIKGGVGKTRVTAGVGTVFAFERGQPVLAIDADTYGGLGRFVDPKALNSIGDLLAAKEVVVDYPKARHYTGKNPQGLEVLPGNQNVANPMNLNKDVFYDTAELTRRFYQLTLVDCGAKVETEFFKTVLSNTDALMIIGSCNAEGGLAIETTVEWLAARNGHELLKRSVIVLNDIHDCASKAFIAHITETVGPRVRSVKTIPWDAHLRDADTLDFPALHKRTRLAFLELAAELAEGFPTAGALSA
ncbi:MinD/ParA family protein [Mycobacterium intracellulare]|uniref:MinD/ParA family ATP-binding protein n=1 Tax=Mycobacterium intracellulare TaxID=1767 RepID=UPI000C79DC0A|nr:MinD/ParA family protein [Mycobacterium intracellulare]